MKGILVIIDGVADEPTSVLKEDTPLEAAKLDYCYPVKKDFTPESNEGVLSLLGYDPFLIKRGTLETLGLGVQLKNGDLAFRCNFATIDNVEDANILDRRAGRTLTTKEARILAEAVNKEVKLPFKFEFYPAVQHRGALVIRGGFSDNITGVEANAQKLKPQDSLALTNLDGAQEPNTQKWFLTFSHPLDEEDDSKLSSELINQFVRKSFEVLDRHPINLERTRKGFFPANVILCRGPGSEKPKLKKIKGKWLALGYMPLEKGIAKALGMDIYKFSYPPLKKFDVYDNLYAGLWRAMKYSIKMLRKNKKKYDYFYIHLKETDIPGHDNKPLDKLKMIEILDKKLLKFLRKFIKNEKLIITADHTTACRKKAHTADPVPVLSYPFTGKGLHIQRFTESCALQGKQILGRRLLKEKMFDK